MNSLEQSVAESLDGGGHTGLLPHIPYLLQDLWELGSSPEIMVELLQAHVPAASGPDFRALDLGCGKGAVSVRLAKELGIRVLGVDGLPAFIDVARQKALEHGVADLCQLEGGDIREGVSRWRDFDLAILGAVGPVFGSMQATLAAIRYCLKPSGVVLMDDAYVKDDHDIGGAVYLKWPDFLAAIGAAGFDIVAMAEATDETASDQTDMVDSIARRAHELSLKHPDQKPLFDAYLRTQRTETAFLATHLTGVTLLLRRSE